MLSRREVFVRTLALLQRKTLIETKKSHIKMLKTALFDCAINEKYCSVDGGRGICPLFLSPPRGIWKLNSPHLQEFAVQGKKDANAPGGGGINYAESPKPTQFLPSKQHLTVCGLESQDQFGRVRTEITAFLTYFRCSRLFWSHSVKK